MAEKRVPLRMCCVCRRYFPKNELFRVVKTPDGKIFLDDEREKQTGAARIYANPSNAWQSAPYIKFSTDSSAKRTRKFMPN